MNEQQSKKSSLRTFTIKWKNPDAPANMAKWGEYGEYFEAEVVVDHKTGKGTIQFFKP